MNFLKRVREGTRQRVQHFARASRFVYAASPKWTAMNVGVMVVQGILPAAVVYLLKLIVDSVSEAISSGGGSAAFPDVATWVGIAGGVTLLMGLCRIASRYISEEQAEGVSDYMQGLLHSKSIEVDLEYYESPTYFDAFHRAQREAPTRPLQMVNGLVAIIRSSIGLAALGGVILLLDWRLLLILVAASVPALLVKVRSSRAMYEWRRRRTETEREGHYYNWLMTWEPHAKEIRLLGIGPLIRGWYQDVRTRLRGERQSIGRRRAIWEGVTELLSVATIFGSYAYVAYRTLTGVLTLGSFVMFYAAFQRAQTILQEFLTGISQLYESNLFLVHLYEFLDLKPKVQSPAAPAALPPVLERGFELKDVSFRYPETGASALRDVTLTIPAGQTVAIVGPNGSGKTTLVKLLCRLYDPSDGSILLDGIDLREIDPEALRGRISAVLQDFGRYHMTARENIAFGDIHSAPDLTRIREAAALAGMDDTIARLEDGYETLLGRMFRKGTQLSEGQWQKLALARAIVRDSGILILDEPTSSIDAETEYQIFKEFHRLARGRTTILISHRLSTVRFADQIVVLEQGRVVEQGRHDELMAQSRTYATMFAMQAEHYH